MPILQQPSQETTKVYLPSTENLAEEQRAWVALRDKVTAYDITSRGGVRNTSLVLGVASFIADWNFTDEKGNKRPINADTVGWLEGPDFNFLLKQVNERIDRAQGGLDEEAKKASLSGSTQSSTVENPVA